MTSNEAASDSLLRSGQASRWVLRKTEAHGADLVGYPAPLLPLLSARGIESSETARRFFTPSLGDLHDPMTMLGMGKAVGRIQAAVAAGEPILIYGDYDVDGTTATVLLKTAIERLASPDKPAIVRYHIPHRIREGYGMQTGVLGQAALDGIRLVISVDTGIRAFAAADEARMLGLDLIVTDHHLPDGVAGIPDALAVINPAQPGCPYPNKHLCGAGVAFQLAHALLAAHAQAPQQAAYLKDRLLPSFLKLVAIATIADSVELTGENRAIAWLGLRELANPVQPGLKALMRVAKLPLDRAPTATEVGFRLGPRINAAGRMDIAAEVVELFLTRDPDRAALLAEKLDTLNQQRRDTEAAALEAIDLQLIALRAATGEFAAQALVLDHPEWHRGVLGILASRVVERTGRPALVLCSGEPGGDAHGSGRSIAGYHLLDALTAIDAPSALFTRFGGHAHAVGFSLPASRVGELRLRLVEHSTRHLDPATLVAETWIDAELERKDLTLDLARWIARCAPFGVGNPEPVFLVRGLVVAGAPRIIQEKHLCLPLVAATGCDALSAMGWSRGSVPWSQRAAALELGAGSVIDAVVRVGENQHPQYGGLELQLVDFGLHRATSAVDGTT